MSFLAYVLRVYAHQLQEFLPTLPEIVVRLLKDCPRERSGARKVSGCPSVGLKFTNNFT